MHKNTVIVIFTLSIIAALLVGLNIGRRIQNPTPAFPSPTTQIIAKTHTSTDCGVSFAYDPDFDLKTATASAMLTRGAEKIAVACQKDIPRPPLPPEKTEEITVAGQKTTLYHDASQKDGTPIDMVVIKNEKKQIDVAFLGLGEGFKKLLTTVKLSE